MNMIRYLEKDFREGFWISNVTCYINFRAPNLPSFDFRVLQMSCIWKNYIKSLFPSWWIWLEMGEEDCREGFWISKVTCYINFRAPNLPSFEFRVLQMSCIWKNSMKSSFPSWWIWLETGNRIIEKDFEFQMWHAI